MSIPCPCCKASNDAGPNCRRCKADLALLFAIEADRTALMERARVSNPVEALEALDRAERLRQGDDIVRLKAAARLLQRDFAGAFRTYHELASRAGGKNRGFCW